MIGIRLFAAYERNGQEMIELTRDYICALSEHFAVEGNPVEVAECNNGHINHTFFVTLNNDGEKSRYVLQRINTSIFTDYRGLMNNISAVTEYLREKYRLDGYADYERRTLTVIPSTKGENYYVDDLGNVWRMYKCIENATCYQAVESDEMFKKVGAAFGRFQKDLADFDASVLCETIKNFHNTESRLSDLYKAIEENKAGRADSIKAEIEFVSSRADLCSSIVSKIQSGEIPLRVTHNDTKLNNIMMDDASGEGICILDLDTVMPGSALYDFGDSIRFGASSAAEDETDLSKVYMREDMFRAFADGFLCAVGDSLTDNEIRMLPLGAVVITLETGIRFLTDYLNGDTYFKTAYPEHNLDRARNQFKLVSDMEGKADAMNAAVAQYLKHKNS